MIFSKLLKLSELDSGFEENDMIELRHRPSSRNTSYQRLSTDDDQDEISQIHGRSGNMTPVKKSPLGKQ